MSAKWGRTYHLLLLVTISFRIMTYTNLHIFVARECYMRPRVETILSVSHINETLFIRVRLFNVVECILGQPS